MNNQNIVVWGIDGSASNHGTLYPIRMVPPGYAADFAQAVQDTQGQIFEPLTGSATAVPTVPICGSPVIYSATRADRPAGTYADTVQVNTLARGVACTISAYAVGAGTTATVDYYIWSDDLSTKTLLHSFATAIAAAGVYSYQVGDALPSTGTTHPNFVAPFFSIEITVAGPNTIDFSVMLSYFQ